MQKQVTGGSIKLVNSMEKEKRKAQHTRNQQKIWDSLLKLRIKEQRSLTIANRLPQKEMLQVFTRSDGEIGSSVSRISKSIQEMLGSLLQVGYELRAQHTQLVDTIPEEVVPLFNGEDVSKKSRKRKREFFVCEEDEDPVEFYWRMMEEYSTSPDVFYKDTIDYWQKKTQLASRISQTKFKAINQSIVSQVDAAMHAPEKLIEKTQYLKSTSSRILGKIEQDNVPTDLKDPEVFDDATFYQQLLKSLIEQDGTVDPTEVTRSWLKTRDQNKQKKAYNSKLSKDRVLK